MFFSERGERYGFLNAEVMLFDKDGRPLVFTEPRRTLDGEWELCTLDGEKYIASVASVLPREILMPERNRAMIISESNISISHQFVSVRH